MAETVRKFTTKDRRFPIGASGCDKINYRDARPTGVPGRASRYGTRFTAAGYFTDDYTLEALV